MLTLLEGEKEGETAQNRFWRDRQAKRVLTPDPPSDVSIGDEFVRGTGHARRRQ